MAKTLTPGMLPVVDEVEREPHLVRSESLDTAQFFRLGGNRRNSSHDLSITEDLDITIRQRIRTFDEDGAARITFQVNESLGPYL